LKTLLKRLHGEKHIGKEVMAMGTFVYQNNPKPLTGY
jgi:hypothetical protein